MLLEDSYVKFLIEHNLTQGQYLVLHLAYKKRPDLIQAYKAKFPSGDKSMIGQYFVDDLFTRGYLTRDRNDVITITRKFLDAFINKHTATDEIYSVYPTHYKKDGVSMPLSAMDRNVFANLYDIAIMSSVDEHLEVMQDIAYAIEHELLNIGLEKFIKSKYWLSIRPKRKEGQIREDIETQRDHDFG